MKSKLVKGTLFSIALILLLITININWGKNDWKGALESDAKGYYAYLPAVFIYQDLNFSFLEEIENKYEQTHLYYDYRNNFEGVFINKYYCGVSVLQSPFFFLAHFISYLDHQDLDGYSKWYMLSISIAALFYHLFGLWFFARLLQLYGIKEKVIVISLILISFATNLFVYTIVEAGMSHVFSFTLVCSFLFYSKSYLLNHKTVDLLKLSFSFGLILICRPINGLILVFLPFLSGSFSTFILALKHFLLSFKSVILTASIVVLLVSLQLIAYRIATGSFFVYSYNEEGFNFLNPNVLNILFSYKKGLFLYTPIYLICLLSVFPMLRESLDQFISWMLAFLLITYVFSSWWMWFYGGSFSSRVYVEYIPIFILPLALYLNRIKQTWKMKSMIVVLILITVLCQIQSYQYRYYDIHYSEMTQEKYWEVFLLRNRF